MAYQTITNLKSQLRITDSAEDSVLQLCLDQAIEWVEDFTGRNFSGTGVAITDEEYDLDSLTQTTDGSFIQLKQMDILSVEDVKLGDVSIGADDYKFTPEGRLVIFGRIFDVARRAFNDYQYVKVSYTYGTTTFKTIEGAILMLAMSFWNDRLAMNNTTAADGSSGGSSANNIKSERIGEYSVNYGGGNESASQGAENLSGGNSEGSTGTMNSIARMLHSYRKRRV